MAWPAVPSSLSKNVISAPSGALITDGNVLAAVNVIVKVSPRRKSNSAFTIGCVNAFGLPRAPLNSTTVATVYVLISFGRSIHGVLMKCSLLGVTGAAILRLCLIPYQPAPVDSEPSVKTLQLRK